MKYITYDATNKIRILRKTKHMIFKAGDTVYHWNFGKGHVTRTGNVYVDVVFGPVEIAFLLSGKFICNESPSLSFTPYNLVSGGFSHNRPRPDIKPGQLIYVRHHKDDPWKMRYFSHWPEWMSKAHENGGFWCFMNQKKEGDCGLFYEYSITNPLCGVCMGIAIL